MKQKETKLVHFEKNNVMTSQCQIQLQNTINRKAKSVYVKEWKLCSSEAELRKCKPKMDNVVEKLDHQNKW